MKPIIPFSGQVEDSEQSAWIEAINANTTRFRITPIKDISEKDKNFAELAVVANPDVSDLNNLPALKWVQSLWAGVDGLLASDLNPNIAIVRLTDPQMATTMSEAVLAWCLYLHRKMPAYKQQQSNAEWRPLTLSTPQQCRISVFGLGKLGAAAAQRLQRNQFTVQGWSRSKKSLSHIQTFYGETGFRDILSSTDIAVILLPRTASTEGLFNTEALQLLPDGASVINFARGPIVVENDLLASLDTGHIDHAVLDVFNHEPLPGSHPYWHHPGITVLPHISAPTTIATAADIAVNNIEQYIECGKIPDAVERNRGY